MNIVRHETFHSELGQFFSDPATDETAFPIWMSNSEKQSLVVAL